MAMTSLAIGLCTNTDLWRGKHEAHVQFCCKQGIKCGTLCTLVCGMAAFVCQSVGLYLNNNWMYCYEILSRLCPEDKFP